ncbi:MAG: SRPBCC family protein [Solirubrobacteraceae bacterium]
MSFDAEAEPLADRLGEVDDVLDGYRLDDWRIVDRIAWGESPANWKIVMENGRECYHHQGTHRDTLEPLWPTSMAVHETTDSSDWWYQRMMVSPDAAIGQEDGHWQQPLVLPAAPGLSAFQRSHYLIFGLYPAFICAPGPDMTVVIRFYPTGHESHKVDFEMLVHEDRLDDPDMEQAKGEFQEFIRSVQQEDADQAISVQRSLRSITARGGGAALSPIERPIWQFQRYLAKRLTGDFV